MLKFARPSRRALALRRAGKRGKGQLQDTLGRAPDSNGERRNDGSNTFGQTILRIGNKEFQGCNSFEFVMFFRGNS